MWTTIASLFFGALPTVVEAIGKAKKAALDAQTEHEKIAANERVKALEAQRDVLIGESRTPWNSVVRAILIAPVAFYLSWCYAYDKIICKWVVAADKVGDICRTDPLSDWLAGIAMMMIGFYFVTDITRMWKR